MRLLSSIISLKPSAAAHQENQILEIDLFLFVAHFLIENIRGILEKNAYIFLATLQVNTRYM